MRQTNRKYFQWLILALMPFCLAIGCTFHNSEDSQSSSIETSSQAATQMRVVAHASGETRVPINPQRVVAIGVLDYVLALGVNPIGSTDTEELYLSDRVEGIATIGYQEGPNIERILSLRPDLIVGSNDGVDSVAYAALSQIAPTVLSNRRYGSDWKDIFFKQAEALGKIDEFEQFMEDYNARLKNFKQQMGDRLSQTKVSLVRVYPDRVNLYLNDSFCGSILKDAGLQRPLFQDLDADESFAIGGNSIQISISKEVMEQADGDVIFVFTFGSTDDIAQRADAAFEQLQLDPLWLRLIAVQRDKVFRVPAYWIGEGAIAANLVLDDLFKYLIDEWKK